MRFVGDFTQACALGQLVLMVFPLRCCVRRNRVMTSYAVPVGAERAVTRDVASSTYSLVAFNPGAVYHYFPTWKNC